MGKIVSFIIHLFTASGLVLGLMAMHSISLGNWNESLLFLLVAFIIDGVDGMFARIANVKHHLPEFDGKTIDYLADFLNYAIVPAYFIWQGPFLSEEVGMIFMVGIVLSSGIYYARDNMVIDDQFFKGFPVLWNIVVFILFYVFTPPEWTIILILIVLIIAQFLPIYFPYPSKSKKHKTLHLIISLLIIILALLSVLLFPKSNLFLRMGLSMGIFYFITWTILHSSKGKTM